MADATAKSDLYNWRHKVCLWSNKVLIGVRLFCRWGILITILLRKHIFSGKSLWNRNAIKFNLGTNKNVYGVLYRLFLLMEHMVVPLKIDSFRLCHSGLLNVVDCFSERQMEFENIITYAQFKLKQNQNRFNG